jgi:hypothetical protein
MSHLSEMFQSKIQLENAPVNSHWHQAEAAARNRRKVGKTSDLRTEQQQQPVVVKHVVVAVTDFSVDKWSTTVDPRQTLLEASDDDNDNSNDADRKIDRKQVKRILNRWTDEAINSKQKPNFYSLFEIYCCNFYNILLLL